MKRFLLTAIAVGLAMVGFSQGGNLNYIKPKKQSIVYIDDCYAQLSKNIPANSLIVCHAPMDTSYITRVHHTADSLGNIIQSDTTVIPKVYWNVLFLNLDPIAAGQSFFDFIHQSRSTVMVSLASLTHD